jgi:hypothetical protein
MPLARLKPAVPKHWLIAIAGAVWLAAGIVLCGLAWKWLQTMPLPTMAGLLLGGILLAVGFHRFLLARIVHRNLARIARYADKGCLFAFQAWRSYLLILVMIALGAFLRHTALPREILAFLYAAMGGALALSSLAYFSGLRRYRGSCTNASSKDDEHSI